MILLHRIGLLARAGLGALLRELGTTLLCMALIAGVLFGLGNERSWIHWSALLLFVLLPICVLGWIAQRCWGKTGEDSSTQGSRLATGARAGLLGLVLFLALALTVSLVRFAFGH